MKLLSRVSLIARSNIPRIPSRQERADRREERKLIELERLRMENPDAAFELDLERALRRRSAQPKPVPGSHGPSAWSRRADM